MILYLSSSQHTNLLDFTNSHDVKKQKTVKKLVGNFVLKQFVVYDMRNFSHFTDIVLDRIAFSDSDGEFVAAIEEFLTMYNPRITVICEGITQGDTLFTGLLECGVGNIVCQVEIMEIQQEIRECLSEKGMVRYRFKERPASAADIEKYRFECENIRIAVISSQPRIGATTVAMGFCSYLQSVGATVSYVEANKSGHLSYLSRSYAMETTEEGFLFEGVSYQNHEGAAGTNFIVYDMGNDFIDRKDLVFGADVIVAVCGTKPYELAYTLRMQKQLASVPAFLVCSFTAEGVREDIRGVLQNDFHKLLFTEYQPELTEGNPSKTAFKEVILPYTIEMC